MSILTLNRASLIFGHPPIIDGVELVIEPGERICLVGRNGSGKSTLLKVIAGELQLDDGQRNLLTDLRIARLEQDPPMRDDQSIFSFVASGMQKIGTLLNDYFDQLKQVETDHSEQALKRLEKLQGELDHHNAWQFEQQIEQTLTKLGLDGSQPLSELSGGWRRKAALAKALVGNPQLLLLDEPTNHLDVNMIKWLEQNLLDYQGAVVFVSHDRAFIRKMATRIIDLDRGKLVSYPGKYEAYLDKKAQDLQIEEEHNQAFDKKLSQEETWIRQGIKARRTRNEGRVRALKALREEHKQRRNVQGRASATLTQASSSGKMVFECTDMSYQIADKSIVKQLDFSVMRGDKLALIGPNGCGKSTLIKLFLGELEPIAGNIRQGVNLDIAYFDQHRANLDQDKTVIDVVADGKREVELNGRSKHVISYLQDYLFTPERINVPVSALSGGEKNRLLLAKLLAKPSNLLILDEPTNDLDIETLELLEEILGQYQGTVILVSHDRDFVDNVATHSLFFEGEGRLNEFVGGFSEVENWYRQQSKSAASIQKQSLEKAKEEKVVQAEPANIKPKKLSYKLQLELEKLPQEIEVMEAEVENIQAKISAPTFFNQNNDDTNKVLTELAQKQEKLAVAYARWEELDSMQS